MNSRFKVLIGLTASAGLMGTAAALATLDDHDKATDGDKPKVAEVGKEVPDFELKDLDGKTHKLSDHRGKYVILEWFNPECPFVVHIHQDDHPYKEWSNKLHDHDDFVVFAVNSGAPGQQGTGLEKNRGYQERWNIKYPILIDEPGAVGRAYQARRTPQMYLIDKEGVLRYMGAIDNAPMGRPRDSDERVSYIKRAVEQLKAGETVTPDTTREYGCTVKYVEGTPADRRGRGARGEDGQRGEPGRPGRGGRGGSGEGGRGGQGGGGEGGRGGQGG